MRTEQRRHNDQKKLKQRLEKCITYSNWRGRQIVIPQSAINKMKNGHRSEYKRHGCRCPWCMEGKIYKSYRGDQIADWEEGQDYKHLLPKRHKLYFCEDLDSGSKWIFKKHE
jgi:hypothetical protein